jgi:hypothetical protein
MNNNEWDYSKQTRIIEMWGPAARPAPDEDSEPKTVTLDSERPSYEEVREMISLEGTSNLVEIIDLPDGRQVIGNEEARYVSYLNRRASEIVSAAHGSQGEWVGPAVILAGPARWTE